MISVAAALLPMMLTCGGGYEASTAEPALKKCMEKLCRGRERGAVISDQ